MDSNANMPKPDKLLKKTELMKIKFFLKCLPLVCFGAIGSACSNQQLPIQIVYSSSQCDINHQLLRQITNHEEFKQLLESRPRKILGSKLPILDYSSKSYILFALGQKSTGGYGITLDSKIAVIEDQKLHLPVRIIQPASDSMQAQVLTSPCQIFSIPKTEFSGILLN